MGEKMMGTRREWGYKIPKGMTNSTVSEDGSVPKNSWKDENGVHADWNFDEWDDEDKEAETSFDNLSEQVEFNPATAQKARENTKKNRE